MIDSAHPHVLSRIAAGALAPGLMAFRGTTDDTARAPAATDAATADVDAFVTTTATAAGILTLDDGTEVAGVIGLAEFFPPRRIDFILSSHANWDLTVAVLTYEDEQGRIVAENLNIPDTGGVTLTSAGFARRFVSLVIPAQSGTGGSFTVGTNAALGDVGYRALGISVYDATREPGAYAQYDDLPICRRGTIWVTAENAVNDGDDVYVRFISGGASEVYGALRSDSDAGDAVRLEGARFASTTTTTGQIARVELNLP
jgi:hypothetical protein